MMLVHRVAKSPKNVRKIPKKKILEKQLQNDYKASKTQGEMNGEKGGISLQYI